ncbi:MAG: mitofilin family membrane protein [Pseudomonadota bacterium]
MTENDKQNEENEAKAADEDNAAVDAEIVEDEAELVEDVIEAQDADPVSEASTEEEPEPAKTGSNMPFYAVAALAGVIVATVIVVSGNQDTALIDEDGVIISDAVEESTILFPTPRTADGPIDQIVSPVVPEAEENTPVVVEDDVVGVVVEPAPEDETAPIEELGYDSTELAAVPTEQEVAEVAVVEETTPREESEPQEPAVDETAVAEAARAAEDERAEGLQRLAEEREAERETALAATAAAEEQAARERIAGLRRLAEERAAERRAMAPPSVPAEPAAPQPEPEEVAAPVVAEAAPAPVAVIPEEQIETLRREIVQNVASIVENVSDDVREGVTSDVLAQTEEVIDTRFAETQAQVAQTQAQLQQTEQTIGSQLSQTQAALQQTDRRLAEIQRSLSAQQQASQAQISQLDTRIEQLQTRDVAVAQRGALLIAVTELGDRIDSGQPFRRQLNAIEAITGGRTELTELRPFADQGLPSDDAMRASFDQAARAALAGNKRDAADSALEKFVANLTGLFTVRPVGDVEGDSVGAVIARAEQRLEGGDLGAATQELAQLDGSAETAFADWVAAAQAKAIASRGLRALEQQVTAPRRG